MTVAAHLATRRSEQWSSNQPEACPPWRGCHSSYDEGRHVWEQHAFDPGERPYDAILSREWTAVAPTELEVIPELARGRRLIREGRVPA